jgi:hypothetical protein
MLHIDAARDESGAILFHRSQQALAMLVDRSHIAQVHDARPSFRLAANALPHQTQFCDPRPAQLTAESPPLLARRIIVRYFEHLLDLATMRLHSRTHSVRGGMPLRNTQKRAVAVGTAEILMSELRHVPISRHRAT